MTVPDAAYPDGLNATLAAYARDQGTNALESEALAGVERALTGEAFASFHVATIAFSPALGA